MFRFLVSLLLPFGRAWVEEQEKRILTEGVKLNDTEMADARAIGVAAPKKVRLLKVQQVPLPKNPLIRRVGIAMGLLSTHTAGLAAGYGIFVRAEFWRDRFLIAHELTHTMQYERLGGIRPFLRVYLLQCLTDGYCAAPLELEAIHCSMRVTME